MSSKKRTINSSVLSSTKKQKTASVTRACLIQTVKFKDCSGVYEYKRLFQSRSACLYGYLKSINFDKKYPIFSNMLTIPILLSFMNLSDDIIEENLRQAVQNMFFSQGKEFEKVATILEGLYECNRIWNTSMDSKLLNMIKNNIRVETVFFNNQYEDILKYTQFLGESLGVINRPNFIDQTDSYLSVSNKGSRKLEKIDPKVTAECESRQKNDIKSCEQDSKCLLRTTSRKDVKVSECINATTFRSLRDIEGNRSYIQFKSNISNKKNVFMSRFVMEALGGWGAIFDEYDVKGSVVNATSKVLVTFPTYDSPTQPGKVGLVCFGVNSFRTFYSNAYLVKKNNIPIHAGFYSYIDIWYKQGFSKLNYNKNQPIYIIGTSLGGALTNVCAFYLKQMGYTNVTWYAYGAPRVGGEEYSRYMSGEKWGVSSGNYVKFMNVIKNDGEFFTEFDPVTKYPINQMSFISPFGYSSRFVSNPLMRCMGGGYTWNPVLGTYETQPDYEMFLDHKINMYTPVGADCSTHYPDLHSLGAYGFTVLAGSADYDPSDYNPDIITIKQGEDSGKHAYHMYENSIRNLILDPCKSGCNAAAAAVQIGIPVVFGSIAGTVVGSALPQSGALISAQGAIAGASVGSSAGITYRNL